MMQYAQGDSTAFAALYGRHKAPLYRYLFRHCNNNAITEDLFQEVWAKAIAARDRYQPTAKFTTWLYHIAYNCIVDFWRKQARSAPADVEAESVTAEESAVTAQARSALLQAISQLPIEQRTALLLHEERGFTLEQIAEISGVGRETIKSRLRYALAKLRNELKPEVPS